MKTLLSLVTAIAALIVPAHLRAATVPVTVTINSVMNISAGDPFWGKPGLLRQHLDRRRVVQVAHEAGL